MISVGCEAATEATGAVPRPSQGEKLTKSKPYVWVPGGQPATIQQHSVTKHQVLRSYLVAYLQTLAPMPNQDEIRVTLVDGYAGGGVYTHEATGEVKLGSPFQFLEATAEAEVLLNAQRTKPLAMNIDYFFVEEQAASAAYLRQALIERGYGGRLDQDIRVLEGEFGTHAPAILKFISDKTPRKGRSIFLLDQYGYSDVLFPQIRELLRFPAAEVILTFAVDAFIKYASDLPQTQNTLDRLGVPDVLRGRSIEDIKANEADFRLYIQACMHDALVRACGASFFTVFFIRTEGYGDYWLVHLSQHYRARDVMTSVHWQNHSSFVHYGGAGLDMFNLGYDSRRDADFTGQHALPFDFGDSARDRSHQALMDQLVRRIYARDEGVSFGTLYSTSCNLTPADSALFKEVVASLVDHKDVEVHGRDGARRTKASTIRDDDQIVPVRQAKFQF